MTDARAGKCSERINSHSLKMKVQRKMPFAFLLPAKELCERASSWNAGWSQLDGSGAASSIHPTGHQGGWGSGDVGRQEAGGVLGLAGTWMEGAGSRPRAAARGYMWVMASEMGCRASGAG